MSESQEDNKPVDFQAMLEERRKQSQDYRLARIAELEKQNAELYRDMKKYRDENRRLLVMVAKSREYLDELTDYAKGDADYTWDRIANIRCLRREIQNELSPAVTPEELAKFKADLIALRDRLNGL